MKSKGEYKSKGEINEDIKEFIVDKSSILSSNY
jgi:hypothetical protein